MEPIFFRFKYLFTFWFLNFTSNTLRFRLKFQWQANPSTNYKKSKIIIVLYIYLPYLTLLLYEKWITDFFSFCSFKFLQTNTQVQDTKINKSIIQSNNPNKYQSFLFSFQVETVRKSDKCITFSLLLMLVFIYCFNLLI